MDDYKVLLDKVEVVNRSNNKKVSTDCLGYFKIEATKGDTLVFNKPGFFEFDEVVKRNRGNKIFLEFDYLTFVDKLEANPNMSKSISGGGQAIFILDRKPYEGNEPIDDLTREDIVKVEVLKGQKAVDVFGSVYAKNGVVLIFTNCGYRKKQ